MKLTLERIVFQASVLEILLKEYQSLAIICQGGKVDKLGTVFFWRWEGLFCCGNA